VEIIARISSKTLAEYRVRSLRGSKMCSDSRPSAYTRKKVAKLENELTEAKKQLEIVDTKIAVLNVSMALKVFNLARRGISVMFKPGYFKKEIK